MTWEISYLTILSFCLYSFPCVIGLVVTYIWGRNWLPDSKQWQEVRCVWLEISISITKVYLTCITTVVTRTVLSIVFIRWHYVFRHVIEPSLNYSLSKAYRENVTSSRSLCFSINWEIFYLTIIYSSWMMRK